MINEPMAVDIDVGLVAGAKPQSESARGAPREPTESNEQPPNPGDPGPEIPEQKVPVDPEADPRIPPHSPPARGV
jgi:hypothetical protein